ncbi:MAG: aspartate-semialdehyde dehydrogenase [Bacteroidales bacterium]|nr:aspartate-semialdehyde dehydrogenase [Bacteroidales bacterium]MCF8332903.1 aspartate-semialdehyde dehydrogenase [Bacteroidales bacterium]
MKYKIAVVGATGLVGKVILRVLEEYNFPVSELIPVASSKSVGKKITFFHKDWEVQSVDQALEKNPHIAIFSAGAKFSKTYASKFVEKGAVVIDNSSAWRMEEDVPLIVPEINAEKIGPANKIIANPNCSTIQLVAALAPLHQSLNLKRLVVSTYQSVTGSGVKAVEQLENERKGDYSVEFYPHQIDLNVLPHGGDFLENGYTKEEMKLVNETQKIMVLPDLEITATVVRVPVKGGHGEAVSAEFEKDFDVRDVRDVLAVTKGITMQDNPSQNIYPMPRYAGGKDDVFVGRLRKDLFNEKILNFWIVADNLRKGAATNAVQIAEYLISNKLV